MNTEYIYPDQLREGDRILVGKGTVTVREVLSDQHRGTFRHYAATKPGGKTVVRTGPAPTPHRGHTHVNGSECYSNLVRLTIVKRDPS